MKPTSIKHPDTVIGQPKRLLEFAGYDRNVTERRRRPAATLRPVELFPGQDCLSPPPAPLSPMSPIHGSPEPVTGQRSPSQPGTPTGISHHYPPPGQINILPSTPLRHPSSTSTIRASIDTPPPFTSSPVHESPQSPSSSLPLNQGSPPSVRELVLSPDFDYADILRAQEDSFNAYFE